MARIGSPFIIKGTLGGIDFYVDDGIKVARRAGGVSIGRISRPGPKWQQMAGSLAIVPR